MAGLASGDLDCEITMQIATASQDPVTNQTILTWDTDEANVPAQWLPGGTREAWNAQQRLASYVDGVYRIRDRDPRPTPDASRIIGHDGRTYDVKPYIEDPLFDRDEALLIPVVARGE